MMYLAGDGLPSDYVAAGAWLTRAAAQSYGPAQFNLGLLYERGIGVEQDDRTALGWYVLAAENGQPAAVARITQLRGRIAETGERAPPTREAKLAVQLSWAIVRGLTGVGNDVEVAALTRATTLDGVAVSVVPVDGSDVAPGERPDMPPQRPTINLLTPPVPAILLAEAAEARAGFNHVAAVDRAARGRGAFERGDGLVAMAALLPGAIAGDAESQFLVGRMYEAGLGVAPDPAEAVAWLALAALQGHAGALAAVEGAAAKLDAEQLERATRLTAARNPARPTPPLGVPSALPGAVR
jgi:TPR repeat protein